MGVRWRNEFLSDAGVAWKIDIHDSTYSSTIGAFSSSVNEIRISYKGGAERMDPFFTSEMSVPLYIQTAGDLAMITEINGAQEERFGCMVYKNTVLEWVGVLITDLIDSEDIDYPTIIDLKFTDGIARLKDCDYRPEGSVYSGWADLMDHVIKALTFTGTMQYYGATDHFLRVVIAWHSSLQGYVSNKCTLKYTRLRHEMWYDYEDGVLKYKNAYDVLKELLSVFNARIYMAGGKYNIVQAQENQYPSFYSQTFDKSGTLQASNTADTNRVTPTSLQRTEGGIHKYYPALRKVITSQKHKMSTNWGNLLPPPTNNQYETQVTLLDTVYGGADTDLTLKFDGIVHQWFIGTTGGTFRFKYRMDVILTLADLSKRYLYNGASGASGYTWETTNTSYCTFFAPIGSSGTWSNTLNLSFMTPEIPGDATCTFKFYDLGLVDQYYVAYAPPAGTTYGYEDINFFMKQPTGGSDADIEETKYYAHNYLAGGTTYVTSKMVMERTTGLIGDAPGSTRTLSMFEVTSNLSSWSYNTAWRWRNVGLGWLVHQLAANTILQGQRVPLQKFDGAWINSSITGASVIVWNSTTKTRVWVPLSLTLSLRDDVAKGEFYDCVIPS